VAEANEPAVRFWRDVVREYTAGSCTETAWDNNRRMWRVLSFEPPIGRRSVTRISATVSPDDARGDRR
jgi:hypothetical protein